MGGVDREAIDFLLATPARRRRAHACLACGESIAIDSVALQFEIEGIVDSDGDDDFVLPAGAPPPN